MSDEEKKKLGSVDVDGTEELSPQRSGNTKSNSSEPKETEVVSDINNLPKEAQAIVRMMMSSSRSVSTSSSSLINSLEDKINSEHISTMLSLAEQDNKRGFEDIKSVRIYNLLTLIIVLIFLGFLTVFLANKDLSTYQDVIRIIIIFGGGFGAGFGYKSRIK